MRSLCVRLSSVALLGAFVVGLGATPAVQGQARPSLTSALGRFGEQVAAYAALHRQTEESLSSAFERAHTLRAILRARARLAVAIKSARPAARQGDIVSPAVADIFRRTIAESLSGIDSEVFFERLYAEDAVPAGFRPRVHDTYPGWATHEMPLVVLERLPLLPEELEYRLIGDTLVLWDVDADLIIDIVPDALPGPTS